MPSSRPETVLSSNEGAPEIPAGTPAPQFLPKSFPGRETLTPREREVLALILAGRSGKEAGRALAISQRTVEFHRANLMAKIGARKTVDLVRKVLCVSLADPSDDQQDSDGACKVSLAISLGQP
jgi:DNA-binding CsgD family transcriptional regulator